MPAKKHIRLLSGIIYISALLNLTVIPVCQSQVKKNVVTRSHNRAPAPIRERISINDGWKFMKYTSNPDQLIYDIRPEVTDRNDNVVADSKPTEAVTVMASLNVLKNWILSTANEFINDPAKHHQRPAGNPGSDFSFIQNDFNDAHWESVDLPHHWAIKGPFYKGEPAAVGGGMGRLPSPGVAWYRRKLVIPAGDRGKNIYLDIDGAINSSLSRKHSGWPKKIKITHEKKRLFTGIRHSCHYQLQRCSA